MKCSGVTLSVLLAVLGAGIAALVPSDGRSGVAADLGAGQVPSPYFWATPQPGEDDQSPADGTAGHFDNGPVPGDPMASQPVAPPESGQFRFEYPEQSRSDRPGTVDQTGSPNASYSKYEHLLSSEQALGNPDGLSEQQDDLSETQQPGWAPAPEGPLTESGTPYPASGLDREGSDAQQPAGSTEEHSYSHADWSAGSGWSGPTESQYEPPEPAFGAEDDMVLGEDPEGDQQDAPQDPHLSEQQGAKGPSEASDAEQWAHDPASGEDEEAEAEDESACDQDEGSYDPAEDEDLCEGGDQFGQGQQPDDDAEGLSDEQMVPDLYDTDEMAADEPEEDLTIEQDEQQMPSGDDSQPLGEDEEGQLMGSRHLYGPEDGDIEPADGDLEAEAAQAESGDSEQDDCDAQTWEEDEYQDEDSGQYDDEQSGQNEQYEEDQYEEEPCEQEDYEECGGEDYGEEQYDEDDEDEEDEHEEDQYGDAETAEQTNPGWPEPGWGLYPEDQFGQKYGSRYGEKYGYQYTVSAPEYGDQGSKAPDPEADPETGSSGYLGYSLAYPDKQYAYPPEEPEPADQPAEAQTDETGQPETAPPTDQEETPAQQPDWDPQEPEALSPIQDEYPCEYSPGYYGQQATAPDWDMTEGFQKAEDMGLSDELEAKYRFLERREGEPGEVVGRAFPDEPPTYNYVNPGEYDQFDYYPPEVAKASSAAQGAEAEPADERGLEEPVDADQQDGTDQTTSSRLPMGGILFRLADRGLGNLVRAAEQRLSELVAQWRSWGQVFQAVRTFDPWGL